jgi:hypothetical protein
LLVVAAVFLQAGFDHLARTRLNRTVSAVATIAAISNSMVSEAARNFDRDIGSGIDLDNFDEIEGQLPEQFSLSIPSVDWRQPAESN